MTIVRKTLKIGVIYGFSMMLLACTETQEAKGNQEAPVKKELIEAIDNSAAHPVPIAKLPADMKITNADFLNYDMVMGDPNAPLEIIEYAAATCGGCQHFHGYFLPAIKEKYIDTGKVKLVFRSFLLNAFDIAPSALMRCAPKDKFFPYVKMIFQRQKHWLDKEAYIAEEEAKGATPGGEGFSNFSTGRLLKMAGKLGLDADKMKICMEGNDLKAYMMAIVEEGVDTYGVSGTPQLFVGKDLIEYNTLEELNAQIEKQLLKIKIGN
jgi:protein-disulfide isomerase